MELKFYSKRLATGALTLAVLTATTFRGEAQQAGRKPGLCRPEAADSLVGRDRVTDAEAMRLTGATIVRQIRPGQGVTMDYRRERVTIETDPKTNRILRAMCG
ncbi:MAG TPA: I78 family peptidase inhibitor [Rhodoblastus sp.]|nr:I78 family peptidase inhibitor [Rhodoblastus sp.]